MKKLLPLLIISVLLCACGKKNSEPDNGASIDKQNSAQIEDLTGYYIDNNNNEIEITQNNNTAKVTVSLYRLAQLESENAVVEGNSLFAEAIDPAGKALKFSVYQEGKSYTLEIMDTTWDYLEAGQKFNGFNKSAGYNGSYAQKDIEAIAVSAEEQKQLIMAHYDEWTHPDAEYCDWHYAFTDLDHNGRLEVIAASMQGTGLFTWSNYYEVNDTFNAIEPCKYDIEDGDSEPDIITDSVDCYYDPSGNTYYYVFADTLRNGAAEHWTGKYAISLKNGIVSQKLLASVYEIWENGGAKCTTIYNDAYGKEISEKEYNVVEEKTFSGLQKKEEKFEWIRVSANWYAVSEPEQVRADERIVITKQPRGETVVPGGNTWFISNAENATTITWLAVDSNNDTYTLQEAMQNNPGLELEELEKGTLALRNIPASFNGWGVYAVFANNAESVLSDTAYITLK